MTPGTTPTPGSNRFNEPRASASGAPASTSLFSGRSQIAASSGSPTPYRPWLYRLSILLVLATFLLIVLGGTVTSRNAGLSVPDWPQTYEHNMFTSPPSLWWTDPAARLEHTHRLKGTVVGLLTIAVAVSLWKTQKSRRWLRWLGLFALLLVIVQGVLGGLRVTLHFDYGTFVGLVFAVVHGVVGQLFLCVTALIAAAVSRRWLAYAATQPPVAFNALSSSLRTASVLLLLTLLIQLTLGAAVRHSAAGLAIPDFPSSFGRLIPPLSQDEIVIASQPFIKNMPAGYPLASPGQVAIHFAHRIWGLVVVVAMAYLMHRLSRVAVGLGYLLRPALGLTFLVILQIALGAAIIWTGTRPGHPEVATAHQALGSILLATAALLTYRIHLLYPSPLAPSSASPPIYALKSHPA
ncbi:MAG: COX15/CtaA family protein [Phycisphaeraceae bacterium]|nr:COX15/CtaA family protein [Phycisphaeraceae bacterium]